MCIGQEINNESGIASPIINSLFQFRCNTNDIRNFREIFTENRKTVKYGMEIVTYRAQFFWVNLHTKHKNAKSLDEFKSKVKVWKCGFCHCRLCKKYVQIVGFIISPWFYLKESIINNQGRLDNKNSEFQR